MTNHNALARQFTRQRQLLHGAGGLRRGASLAGRRAAEQLLPDDLYARLGLQGEQHRARAAAPPSAPTARIAPEDYPEAGSMWEHLARNGIRFRNYGEGFEFAGVDEDEDEHRTGAREVVNIPMSKVAVRQHLPRVPDLQHEHPGPVPRRLVRARLRRSSSCAGKADAGLRQHRHLQRPRHRPETREGLSLPGLLDGGQRPGAGPDRRVPLPHARTGRTWRSS